MSDCRSRLSGLLCSPIQSRLWKLCRAVQFSARQFCLKRFSKRKSLPSWSITIGQIAECDPRNEAAGGLGHLLELWYFKEWCKGHLHCSLCLYAKLSETLLAKRAVFEFSAVSLLCEPFSTVPTLHTAVTHISQLSPPFY